MSLGGARAGAAKLTSQLKAASDSGQALPVPDTAALGV